MNAYIARQPIFKDDNTVCAYEILYRDNESALEKEAHIFNDDVSFFGLRISNVTGGLPAYINFTEDMLLRGVVQSIAPEEVVAVVSAENVTDDDTMQVLRELSAAGYTLALDGFTAGMEGSELFSLCSIVIVSFGADIEKVENDAKTCYAAGKTVLGADIDERDVLACAKDANCEYTSGRYFTKPVPGRENNIQPLPTNFTQIMKLMSQPEPEFRDIVEVISRDTAMCQRLLRLINSVYFGVRNRVSSINQALVILGLDYLREWVYLMGMQRITHNDNIEIMRMSVLMAKLCRQLSLLIPEAARQSEAFYLMGLLSMVTYSGERALAIALEEFPVTDDIKSGLLRRGGLYSDVFDMAMRYEKGDWAAADEFSKKYNITASKLADVYIHCVADAERIKLL